MMSCLTPPEFTRNLDVTNSVLNVCWYSAGGFLVQRSIRGRAAEMGRKISLLV